MHHNYPSRLRSALCVLGRRSGDAFLILKVRFGAKADLKFAVWAISGAARDRPRDRAGRDLPDGLLVDRKKRSAVPQALPSSHRQAVRKSGEVTVAANARNSRHYREAGSAPTSEIARPFPPTPKSTANLAAAVGI